MDLAFPSDGRPGDAAAGLNSRRAPLTNNHASTRPLPVPLATGQAPVLAGSRPVVVQSAPPGVWRNPGLMDSSPPPPPHNPYAHMWNPSAKQVADARLLREQERDKAERERERLEKLKGAEQAVDKHFEESLRPQRLAQHKQRSSSWNLPTSFPTNTRVVEEPVSRMRQERYCPPQPAPVLLTHPRFPSHKTPEQGPPYAMYPYPPGFPLSMMKHEPPNNTPPPNIMNDVKNSPSSSSVIVKNDNKKPVRSDLYRTSPALLLEAQNLQQARPLPYPAYTSHPASAPPSPKVKVSSPAPAHIYGQPNAQSSKPPLSTSPYQQMPTTYQPPPLSNQLPPPPPAHSGGAYQSPNQFDAQQPLDLGLCLTKSSSISPKRKIEFEAASIEVSPAKKSCQPLSLVQQEPLSLATISSISITAIPATPTIPPNNTNSTYPSHDVITSSLTSNYDTNYGIPTHDIGKNNATVTPLNNITSSLPTSNVSSIPSIDITNLPCNISTTTPSTDFTTPPTTNMIATPSIDFTTLPPTNMVATSSTDFTSLPATNMIATPSTDTSSLPSTNSSPTPAQPIASTSPVESGTSDPSASKPADPGGVGVHKLKKAWLQRHSGVESTTPPPPSIARESNVNGHVNHSEDSSSSESEASRGAVNKMNRTKKSASSTDSDSRSESGGGRKKANGSTTPNKINNKKTPRKSSDSTGNSPSPEGNNEEPEEKKPKKEDNDEGDDDDDENHQPRDNMFNTPPVSQLKKTGESFLQDGECFKVAPKLPRCRECRSNQTSRNTSCRFYAFRLLRYTKNAQLAIAGFSDPYKDASIEDVKLWLPDPENAPSDVNLELSKFILRQLADQFFELIRQEEEAIKMNMSEDKFVAWKRVVKGYREMCDVCETTLFNFHWACGKCGFGVCIDCYRDRKTGCNKVWGDGDRGRDETGWLLCNSINRQVTPHEQEKLMLTQIIAADSLKVLGQKMTEYKIANNISLFSRQSKGDVKSEECHITWLKEVLKKQEKEAPTEPSEPAETEKPAASGGKQAGSFSKLRIMLTRRKTDAAKSEVTSDAVKSEISVKTEPPENPSATADSTEDPPTLSGGGTLDPATGATSSQSGSGDLTSIASASESPPGEEDQPPIDGIQLAYFQRRRAYGWAYRLQTTHDVSCFTNAESKRLYPDVPHMWLGDGKLLRLTDSKAPGNYKIFQDMWRRGQPVLVSGAGKQLNLALWRPESFAADFGDLKNDLINCVTGNIVPNQTHRKFWEGFENCSKRLKDGNGNAMLLKLKDWPPGEDFAELMPTRFEDLMRALPLGEYTQRTGRLNLAARLPDSFVKPDLGPKMYIAYGNVLNPNKATTNLHLDISDAVNLMVYVGIPKDGDSNKHIKEAYRAIDEGGSDMLTKRRVRTNGEVPGALWHIFSPRDADKIRDMLNKVAIENGARLERNHDPIHDQSWYLDNKLMNRLHLEYKVKAYTVVQCLGDAVFIPAGAPHQVRNLHSCIKVAEDFVSPENVSHCFHLTQEFRELSDTHSNHEDKLQIKNIIFHAVKDSLSVVAANEAAMSSTGELDSATGELTEVKVEAEDVPTPCFNR